MSEATMEYIELIHAFLDCRLPYPDFCQSFLTRFKHETRSFEEREFLLLDRVFADIDACTSDEELRLELPEYYISEDELRLRLAAAVSDLKAV